jgi:small GTP-binding protein
VERKFLAQGTPTVGVTFKSTAISINGTEYSLKVWDTAGQEVYRSLSEMYYRNGQGILLVFDVTRPDTFTSLPGWFESIDEYAKPGTPVVICANKLDLKARVDPDQAIAFAERRNVPLLFTSAANGEGIFEAFGAVTSLAIEHTDRTTSGTPAGHGGVKIDSTGHFLDTDCCH